MDFATAALSALELSVDHSNRRLRNDMLAALERPLCENEYLDDLLRYLIEALMAAESPAPGDPFIIDFIALRAQE